MESFVYQVPTKIVFGRDAEQQTAACARELGAQRALVVYGGQSAVKSGLLARIQKILDEGGVASESIGGVVPNPRLSLVRAGIEKARAFGAELILAVGGGSVIDTAKAIAHGTANPDADVWDFWTGKRKLEKSMPVASVLTLSAAGSETSNSAVITDDEVTPHLKRGLNTPFNRPKFAIMNPELTYTLPLYQIGAGVTDIFLHTSERYFAAALGNTLTDEFAEGLFRTLVSCGPAAIANPRDYHAMSEIMWCGSVSHCGLTGLGSAAVPGGKEGDWACHQLGHELSARFDATHGATLAAVWGAWARAVLAVNPGRFAQLGRRVFGVTEPDDGAAAQAAISAVSGFFASLGMPTSLTALVGRALTEEELRALAASCSFGGTRTIGAFRVLGEEDMFNIYRAAV